MSVASLLHPSICSTACWCALRSPGASGLPRLLLTGRCRRQLDHGGLLRLLSLLHSHDTHVSTSSTKATASANIKCCCTQHPAHSRTLSCSHSHQNCTVAESWAAWFCQCTGTPASRHSVCSMQHGCGCAPLPPAREAAAAPGGLAYWAPCSESAWAAAAGAAAAPRCAPAAGITRLSSPSCRQGHL